jgi:hypothetical protein
VLYCHSFWYVIICGDLMMGWVGRMLNWDWFLMRISITCAKVGWKLSERVCWVEQSCRDLGN